MIRFQAINSEIELCDIFDNNGVTEFLAVDNHKIKMKIFPLEDELEIEYILEVKK